MYEGLAPRRDQQDSGSSDACLGQHGLTQNDLSGEIAAMTAPRRFALMANAGVASERDAKGTRAADALLEGREEGRGGSCSRATPAAENPEESVPRKDRSNTALWFPDFKLSNFT